MPVNVVVVVVVGKILEIKREEKKGGGFRGNGSNYRRVRRERALCRKCFDKEKRKRLIINMDQEQELQKNLWEQRLLKWYKEWFNQIRFWLMSAIIEWNYLVNFCGFWQRYFDFQKNKDKIVRKLQGSSRKYWWWGKLRFGFELRSELKIKFLSENEKPLRT